MAVVWPLAAAHAQEARVGAHAGRIVFTPAGGAAERVLTTTGRDTTPVLSPDGRLVAFTRGTPGDSVETGLGPVERTELWVIETDGGGERRLVGGRDAPRGGSYPEMSRVLAGLWSPVFSLDGRTVYVSSAAWATSSALHAVDVATGRERFLCDANGVAVVPDGRYRGMLLRWWHHYRPDGAHDEVWVVSPACRPVRLVADESSPDAEARITAALRGRVP